MKLKGYKIFKEKDEQEYEKDKERNESNFSINLLKLISQAQGGPLSSQAQGDPLSSQNQHQMPQPILDLLKRTRKHFLINTLRA